MAPVGTLYGLLPQRQTAIIKAAAAVAGVELNYPEVTFGETNKTPEFLAKFPQGKIPAFEDAEGFTVTEGLAIANYVASLGPEAGLVGKNQKETAQIDQWTHFAQSELQLSSDFSFYLTAGWIPGYNKDLHSSLLERQYKALDYVENYLASREYLVADRLTIADIILAGSVKSAVKITLGSAERVRYPKTLAHLNKVLLNPKIKEAFGEIEFTDAPVQYKGSA